MRAMYSILIALAMAGHLDGAWLRLRDPPVPPVDPGLLPGITRAFLFEVGAEAGIPVREAVLHDADLFAADESFLTSTTREVVPIVRVDARQIGSGVPGPVTKALLDGYRRHAQALTRSQGGHGP